MARTYRWKSTYEVDQPWVVYHYGLTHDRWWPLKDSTRLLGKARIIMECAVCGIQEIATLPIPRFRKVVDEGPHPVRVRFLGQHTHPDRGAPMSWKRPLLNPEAHAAGIDLDALAMRLEADLNESGLR